MDAHLWLERNTYETRRVTTSAYAQGMVADLLTGQLLQQRDFAKGGTRHAFVLDLKPYLFQGDSLSGLEAFGLVNNLRMSKKRGKQKRWVSCRFINKYEEGM